MDEIAVETADADDAERVADLWVDLAADQRAYGSHLRAADNRAVARDAATRHGVSGGLTVARADGDVVGFVMFAPETGSYEQDVERGVVHNIYVEPAYRGRGVGGRLLAAAEEALAAAGANVVSLEVMADNDDARRFYERAGYEPHRVEVEKPLDGGENDTDSREDGQR
ncbi:GNAT family N-acetyltransferase [Candidatus Halobonum tyrrellensis]|uniref:GNAT family acetyltransferase n=1 Tax=Candidatus Halobonum tyrrellensis G22 TaxID=1324957 RepID=V4HJX8_9EURY|nr:GNAT family N-acetyltransferase [Candidatus Halobonum tyrrellensis]ESP88224.1 GNAT family acetyltransferase [Candidatus Halobonum tyrrellensis G22]